MFHLCLSVVVTYKKRAKTTNGVSAQNGVHDTDRDEELASGQFGIMDPEDEGKDWRLLAFGWSNWFWLFTGTLSSFLSTQPSSCPN